ncbi:MAG: single-stranded-DNA-specific exonuclease RecJ [Clostridia bacterium]|nr:single-stranded-DNA-specific exonuclease RecJ [Clostridia bacterium]
MKRILPEFEFTDEQLNTVNALAKECSLFPDTVKILYGRGLRDKESIQKFMHPSREHFISPFKMSGMREAVELITRARDEEWSVVVYGDYDADGVCAATIMGNVLKDFGIEPYICVPERRDGYGLSVALIDSIFDEYFPQLFITVDCGISCADEVEYLKELGAEVIVTDHHELPERIPDCICINPKFNDGYIYDNLCGAGVAFKVGCALNGENAYKYLDFAAIATVADSVPLTGENRDIVYEGLKLINDSPRECYSQFLSKAEGGVNSHTLAFSVAPKINAAGRMGDAKAALQLFSESNKSKIFELSAKLTEYNTERQKYCDELYLSAKEMIKNRGYVGNVILLCNESWNSGFVGIVAARIADEYSRPAILFVKNGNMLKGSARSVENVNIFEALKACSQYIEEFGGHSQAAGVNVSEDNFENLYAALESYISQNYSRGDFTPTIFINGTLKSGYSVKLAKELEMLEPCGVGNRRPMFEVELSAAPVKAVKAQSAHISVKSDKIELMYFGGSKFTAVLESSAPKRLIFEYNISTFRGKEYVKGFIRDVVYDNSAGEYAGEEIALSCIDTLGSGKAECNITEVSQEEIEKAMATDGGFGTVFIAFDYNTVKSYKNSGNFDMELFTPHAKSFASCILIAPQQGVDFSGYSNIYFLDNPEGLRYDSLDGKTVHICNGADIPDCVKALSCERETLLNIFSLVSANEGNLEGANSYEIAKYNALGYNKTQVLFALKVFEQLSLITFTDGKLKVTRGVKTNLNNSELYNLVQAK